MKNHDDNPQAHVYPTLGVPPARKLRFHAAVGLSAPIRRSTARRDFRCDPSRAPCRRQPDAGGVLRSLLAAIFLVVGGVGAWGATWTASVSGNWTNPATWGGGGTPAAGDDVIISPGIKVNGAVTLGDDKTINVTERGSFGVICFALHQNVTERQSG